MPILQNVLVATDFSECSTIALEYARAIAHRFGARLHVMHVFEPASTDAVAALRTDIGAGDEATARRLLEEAVTDDDRRTLQAKLIFVELRKAADAIVEYATVRHIDLVVIGTHGRRGLAHAVVGSVAEHVIRSSPCPVLTVRDHVRNFLAGDLPVVVHPAHPGERP